MFEFSNRKVGAARLASTSSSTKRTIGGYAGKSVQVSGRQVATAGQGFENAGSPNTSIESMGQTYDLTPLLAGLPLGDESPLTIAAYRDIYAMDSVGGPAVDMMSNLPFSEFHLRGLKPEQEKPFQESIERLSARTLLPDISADYLITGAFLASTIFDKDKRIFVDLIPHKRENATFVHSAFYGEPPRIDVKFEKEIVKMYGDRDNPRVKDIEKRMGKAVVEKLASGGMELDPLSTLYLPRRVGSAAGGISWLRRILPIYLYEKNIFKGTLEESTRRQRAILHLILGDETWDPKPEDVQEIVEMFLKADMDPLGAVVATRMGVQTNEIRSAGDFWKVDDLWNSTTPVKQRCLGISEAFLSGDASYNCLSGDTLIPTSEGLRTLSSFARAGQDTGFHDLKVTVGSRFGAERTTRWFKNHDRAPTIEVTLDSGSQIIATPKHRVLAIKPDGTLDEVYVADLTPEHFVARSTLRMVREADNPLRLSSNPKYPQLVTPEFGYWLGALMATGSIDQVLGTISVALTCGDSVQRFVSFARDQLGTDCTVVEKAGDSAKSTRSLHMITMPLDKELTDWLIDLRVISEFKSLTPNENNYNLRINYKDPTPVLRADCNVQAAFFAAMLDSRAVASLHAKSRKYALSLELSKPLIKLVSSLLGCFGILGHSDRHHLRLLPYFSKELYLLAKEHMVVNMDDLFNTDVPDCRGFPCDWLVAALRLRMSDNRSSFKCAAGGELTITNWYTTLERRSFVFYGNLSERAMLQMRTDLGRIDPELLKKFQALANESHMYSRVANIRDAGERQVYDLTMEGRNPWYVANTIVSHNTAENALSVFVDQMRAFRTTLVRKIFYDNLFPLISLTNEFFVSDKAKQEFNKVRARMGGGRANLSVLMNAIKDNSGLIIPTIDWDKQLKPEGDQQYFDMLNALTDKGVPVPLRVLAASAGLNMEKILQGFDDDVLIRSKIADFKKKVAKFMPQDAEASNRDFSATASSRVGVTPMEQAVAEAVGIPLPTRSSVINAMGGRSSLLTYRENEASEITTVSRTGKLKMIHDQRAANERVNKAIAGAVKNLRQKGVI